MIRFCIITCTYNAESLIQRTMDNVASQTWGAVHHVIIDGASTDGTLATVNRIACENEGRVGYTIVSEPDKGLYYAMNKGLQHAVPDYVLFLNAGDTLHSADTLRGIAEKVEDGVEDGVEEGVKRGVEEGVKREVEEGVKRGVKGGVEEGVKGGVEEGVKGGVEEGVKRDDLPRPLQRRGVLPLSGEFFASKASKLEREGAVEVKEEVEKLPGVIYGDTNIVDVTNHYVSKREHNPPEVLTWRSFKDGMLVCHQAFYVRTDIARTVAYDTQYRFSADVDWCIRVMKETERRGLELLNMRCVLCDFLAGGLTIKNHRVSLHERFRIMVKHYGLFTTVRKHVGFVFGKRK